MFSGIRLVDKLQFVQAFAPAVPSSAAPRWISLKGAKALTIILSVTNATTVTGSAVALSQATAVAGTGAKTLNFDKAWRNIDTAAADGLAQFTVASNTFTMDATNSKLLVYVIEVNPADLDVANAFDCVRVTLGNAVAQTVDAVYIITPFYGGNVAQMPSAIID